VKLLKLDVTARNDLTALGWDVVNRQPPSDSLTATPAR
jgi:hypothetical protein